MKPPPDKYVGQWTLRNYFNWGGYYERIKRGDFKIKKKAKLAPVAILEVFGPGTLSVKTTAFDKETDFRLIVTHHYESPAGEILVRNKITGIVTPTGRMDPKRLYHEGVLYHVIMEIIDE